MTSPAITMIPEYSVCAVPESYPDYYYWLINVTYRGESAWSVDHMERRFSRSGAQKTPPQGVLRPRNKNPYRFTDVYEALSVARDIALKVKVNNRTASEYMAWYDALPTSD